MRKVYAVTSGSYSDYRINAIFSSRGRADAFMLAFPSRDYNDVEEYELDPPEADFVARGYSLWSVLMLRNGAVEQAERLPNIPGVLAPRILKRPQSAAYQGQCILQSSVWAKTRAHAILIANETRIRMIANGEWDETDSQHENP